MEPKPRQLFESVKVTEKPARKSLFDDSNVGPKPLQTFIPNADAIPLFYKDHPVLLGKSEDFIKRVIRIDKNTQLTTVDLAVTYGDAAQKRLGEVIEAYNSTISVLIKTDITELLNKFLDLITQMVPDYYMEKTIPGLLFNKKVYPTVDEYMNSTEQKGIELDSILKEIKDTNNRLNPSIQSILQKENEFKDIVDELDAYILTGKIIVGRYAKKFFADDDQKLTVEQFQKKVSDLEVATAMTMIMLTNVKFTFKTLCDKYAASEIQNTESLTAVKLLRLNTIATWKQAGVTNYQLVKDVINIKPVEKAQTTTSSRSLF